MSKRLQGSSPATAGRVVKCVSVRAPQEGVFSALFISSMAGLPVLSHLWQLIRVLSDSKHSSQRKERFTLESGVGKDKPH